MPMMLPTRTQTALLSRWGQLSRTRSTQKHRGWVAAVVASIRGARGAGAGCAHAEA